MRHRRMSGATDEKAFGPKLYGRDPFWHSVDDELAREFPLPSNNEESIVERGGWSYSYTPPLPSSARRRATPPNKLIDVLRGCVAPPQPNPENEARKRRKTGAASEIRTTSTTPFKRKNPVKGVVRSIKIRLLPTVQERQVLMRWFWGARKIYNHAVSLKRSGSSLVRGSFITVRNLLMHKA